MSDPITDFFPHGEDLRQELARHSISIVQLAAACLDAEGALSDFKNGSAHGSRLVFAHVAPPGKRNWQVDRISEIEMTRRPLGWTLLVARKVPPKKTPTRKLFCAAADLLAAAGELTEGPCADRFLEQIHNGDFPIDAALPGAFGSVSHPRPINALAFCALHGRSEWIRKLIALGADPNHSGPYGKTALHHCATSGHMRRSAECARLLLEAGANPRAATDSGKTPAQCLRPEDKKSATGELLINAAKSALESKRIFAAVSKHASSPQNASEASPAPSRKARL